MVLKSPSPTYWAELKPTHLQNTHTHMHSHIHTPEAWGEEEEEGAVGAAAAANGSLRACRNVQVFRALRNARVLRASSSAPSLSPPSSPPHLRPPPPALPPRLGAAGERNLPLPPSPRPSSPLLPPHPPTHSQARGSRLHRHPRPRALPPAPRLATRHPLAAAQGKPRPKGKSCSWDCEDLDRGGGVGELAAPRGKALSFPLFGPRAARFCCNQDRGRKGHEGGRGDRGVLPSLGGGHSLADGDRASGSAQEPRTGTQSRVLGLRTRGSPSK